LDELERIMANIFPSAWGVLWELDSDKWHRSGGEIDAYRRHSSQALAIDYFGTLKTSKDRNLVLNSLALRLGLPSSDCWEVELEWLDEENLLNESRRTQVDAVAFCDKSVLFFECKFKEPDGGTCSQVKPPRRGQEAPCDGYYRLQVNPRNGVESRCSLTGKGIRYWEVIPDIFKLDSTVDHEPCPFGGSNYQWMRNLVACTVVARKMGLTPYFVLVYADGTGLPISEKIKSDNLSDFRALLRREDLFTCLSYQDLLTMSVGSVSDERQKFQELSDWINKKIYDQIRDS
jgi:hypothetical protein